jgi:hypothetical protein
MSIESTAEYKQDRINVRNINSVIVTGKCYKYKDNYYELEENNNRSLIINIPNMFMKLILFRDILTNTLCACSEDDFNDKFVKVEQQLL